MRIVGLTGGIACGKSTVVKAIERCGVPVIDCDKIARQVVTPGSPGLRDIVKHFGNDVLRDDGTLDRKGLGQIIFNDSDKRKVLNKITIPRISRTIMWTVLTHFLIGTPLVVIDAPTLYETKSLLPLCHSVVVVATTEDKQLEWLMRRDGSSEQDARSRINSQMPIKEKAKLAQKVIWNTEGVKEAEGKAIALVKDYRNNLGISRLFCVPGIAFSTLVTYALIKFLI
ncbi:hypothetical protein AAMO2058_001221700 [Amorphochlora amoebiformis]